MDTPCRNPTGCMTCPQQCIFFLGVWPIKLSGLVLCTDAIKVRALETNSKMRCCTAVSKEHTENTSTKGNQRTQNNQKPTEEREMQVPLADLRIGSTQRHKTHQERGRSPTQTNQHSVPYAYTAEVLGPCKWMLPTSSKTPFSVVSFVRVICLGVMCFLPTSVRRVLQKRSAPLIFFLSLKTYIEGKISKNLLCPLPHTFQLSSSLLFPTW